MNKWVGVQSILFGGSSLKQASLIFNRIGILGLEFCLALVADPRSREVLRMRPRAGFYDLLWLIEQGIIFDLDTVLPGGVLVESEEFKRFEDLQQKHLEKMQTVVLDAPNDRDSLFASMAQQARHSDKADEYLLRGLCVALREVHNMEAYPIFPDDYGLFQTSENPKSDVIQVVLNTLPIPDELTSWEHILEYRSDPNSYAKFLDLRNWMSEVARGELTPIEVEQKLEYLMSQYQRHMALHKMKTTSGKVETILVTTAEVLENLPHINLSKAVKALFSIKHKRIELMESELTSPGSEVAYVIEAKESFS